MLRIVSPKLRFGGDSHPLGCLTLRAMLRIVSPKLRFGGVVPKPFVLEPFVFCLPPHLGISA